MVATQLSLYNGALVLCEARRIASLSVNEEGRLVLDDIWNRGAIQTCLEEGLWNFAMRTGLWEADTGYTDPTNAGWYRYTKPSDLVRVAQVSTDPSFQMPDLSYQDEGNYLYTYNNQLYVRYISNDAAFGNNYSLWPATFERAVEGYLASQAVGRLTGARADKDYVREITRQLMVNAKSKDAMREPTRFPPESSWNSARKGFRMGRNLRDYGGRG